MSKAAELAALIGSQTALSNRNLIINGAMQVYQRGSQAGVRNTYAVDRFKLLGSGSQLFTYSQSTTVPSGEGFSYSAKLDVTTADTSVAAGDYQILRYLFEGQDLQHLKYGTSNAESLTLQFWVRSPKTGTHIVELGHTDDSSFNSQSFTIASADTWQKVTLTFDGYQTTSIANDNTDSFRITWWLMAGSDYSGGTLSSNTWQSTAANRAVGQVNVADSTSNEFYITGVQLELGEQATPFEHKSFDDELYRCMRYFEGSTYSNGRGQEGHIWSQKNDSATRAFPYMNGEYRVVKRAIPTVTVESSQDGTANEISGYSSGTNYTVSAVSNPQKAYVCMYFTTSDTLPAQSVVGYYQADAEL